MPRTLVVADKFPPVIGGIETFARQLSAALPADRLVVVAPPHPDAERQDAAAPFSVIRSSAAAMTSPDAGRRLGRLAAAADCSAAWFPSATPRALVTPALRRAGVDWVVGSTHGHEFGWSYVPVGRSVVRAVGDRVDVLTYVTDFSLRRLRTVVSPSVRFEPLTGGVDVNRFRPDAGGADLRRVHGWGGRPVVACVGRLVARKGQDMLIRAWPAVLRRHPGALLLIIGQGPDARVLRHLARSVGVDASVHFTGAVSADALPAYLDAADVFALPSRAHAMGLGREGLGLAALEAAAAGLPVITGAAGGAPDVVRHGETGLVVDGADVIEVAAAVKMLLADPVRRYRMGEAGRAWMRARWTWEHLGARLAALLTPPRVGTGSDERMGDGGGCCCQQGHRQADNRW